MRIYLGIAAIFAAVGVGAIAYGKLGPWYNATPLRAPVSLSSEHPQVYDFRVQRSHKYYIEIVVRDDSRNEGVRAVEQMEAVLAKAPPPHVGWIVEKDGKVVANGAISRRYWSFRGRDIRAVEIATPSLRRGPDYRLVLLVEGGQPEWNHYSPIVYVFLHPARLEYLITLEVFWGPAALCISVLMFALAGLLLFVRLGLRGWGRFTRRTAGGNG
jgi:hypothetical protein